MGAEEIEEDDEAFEEKMKVLTSKLSEQLKQSRELEVRIKHNLKSIGYEV